MSSKQFRADEIAYDNSGTGLISSNVQEALDDVVSMAQAQEQRMTNAVVVCKFATSNLSLPIGGVVPHVFTAAECGGALPDGNYVGALSKLSTCSSSLEGIQVMNAGEPDGPGVVLRKSAANTTACSGPAELVALFHKAK